MSEQLVIYGEYVLATTADPLTARLLRAVGEAWANAEGGIPSEAESRRWSPVVDAAMALAVDKAGAAAGGGE